MLKFFFSLAILSVSVSAYAIPRLDAKSKLLGLFAYANDHNYDSNGAAQVGSCSASLVRFKGQPTDSKAYVLTNGHCIGWFMNWRYMKHNEYKWKEKSNKRITLFSSNWRKVGVKATELTYATMTDTDLALYRIDKNYDQLGKEGIEPFIVSDFMPTISTEIEIISGYWRRGYSCYIDGIAPELLEKDWIFTDSIRYTEECNIIGGTSGSPVIEKGTRTVVGVNNTMNENGESCTFNNPCERHSDGSITVHERIGYGQQIYTVYTCLTENFDIDLNRVGCELLGGVRRSSRLP